MSNDDFDLDALLADTPVRPEPRKDPEPTAPAAVANPVPVQRPQTYSGEHYQAASVPTKDMSHRVLLILGVLFAMACSMGFGVLICFLLMRTPGDVDPVDPVDPVSGRYAAIFYQDTDMPSYTKEQQEFIQSALVSEWFDEKKVTWIKFDEDDVDTDAEIDALPDPWPVLAEKHRTSSPWIVIASGKQFVNDKIESFDQVKKLAGKVLK